MSMWCCVCPLSQCLMRWWHRWQAIFDPSQGFCNAIMFVVFSAQTRRLYKRMLVNTAHAACNLLRTGNTLPSLETCDQSAALIPISKSICAVQISSGEGLRQPRAVRLGEEDPIKTQSHTARQKDTACHVDEFPNDDEMPFIS